MARRYRKYGVFHAHTDELISTHDTRSEAESYKTEHFHRVRGV
jgi:hypothetical protein